MNLISYLQKHEFIIFVQNVDQYFSVVGVLEDWNQSLKVLETFIPRYFAGSTEAFDTGKVSKVINKNMYKPKVPFHVRELIAKNITREIEFYNFCRQRLNKQFLSIL
jgi:dermatan/chondrotin sulfate uronyl 2-O-sulfotransferase UST